MKSTHEQDVVNAKAQIAYLKSAYMDSIKSFVDAQKNNNCTLDEKFLVAQQSGNSYFNFIENFVGDSDLLGAHENGHWVVGFAEDCFAALESLIGHFQLIRSYITKSNPSLLQSIEPSATAYANMQRMVVKYLVKDNVLEIKEKFESAKLPVYGFNNNKMLIMNKKTQTLISFSFGVIFVIVLLVIAFTTPDPTDFQYTIFRIVLSLAAGGVVAAFPGFIEVTFGKWLRSGGALAVFVLVYFYAPAAISPQTPTAHPSKVEVSSTLLPK
ncbi:hypothetical protein V6259_15845 [Marinomonas sp. TI.3.20]|uniref:hypothetical protein n=1 Tax=Marinomonas sp. TI.3.20 TaxID=3121296 RepID=UPI0031203F3E